MPPPPVTLGAELESLEIEDREPWEAPRCVLLIDDTLFLINRPGLWLDSLHIQAVTGKSSDPRLVIVAYWGSLFLTNSVLQGDAQTNAVGLLLTRSLQGAYVESVLSLSTRPLACTAITLAYKRPADPCRV